MSEIMMKSVMMETINQEMDALLIVLLNLDMYAMTLLLLNQISVHFQM